MRKLKMNELKQRYYELYEMTQQDGYLDDTLRDEFEQICNTLLNEIMIKNKDIFVRLKDR